MSGAIADLEKFRQWLVERGRSEQTADQYAMNVRLCFDEPRGPTARLTGRDLAPATRRLNLASLRSYCKYAHDADLSAQLDDLRLAAPTPVVEKIPLTGPDWNEFEDAIECVSDEIVRASLRMMSTRGFRVGAIPALRRKQVTDALSTGVLMFESKRRATPYTAKPFLDSLQLFASYPRWKCVADLLSPRARPKTRHVAARARLQRWVRRVAEKAGIPPEQMYSHRLRRTYSEAFYAEVDGDLVRLRDHMGWADINTAARYVTRDRRAELDEVADNMRRRRRQKGQ